MLSKGQNAPAFSIQNQAGMDVCLADYRDKKYVVLYFYPKDDTPGCTIEANQFTTLADDFDALDTVILGVSKDSCDSHQAFIDKFSLRIDLLADTTGELSEKYGVWQEKEKNGVKKMGIVRSTFVIDKHGMLVDVEYGVNPEGHAQAVLEKIRAIR